MLNSIRIKNMLITPGARAGLGEPTATCRWLFEGTLDDLPDLTPRLRVAVSQLWPSEPMYGVDLEDWPQAFLVDDSPIDSIGAWGVALTVAIQRLARDPVGAGRVLQADQDVISIAFPWQREPVFKASMEFALRHLLLWLQPAERVEEQAQKLKNRFEQWLVSVQHGGLPPNTLRFALAAQQRRIPVSVTMGLLRLGWGVNAERMDSSFTGRTSTLAVRFARNKHQTSRLLHEAGIPVPPNSLVSNWQNAQNLVKKLGWPVVVKPSNQDQGNGVVPGIRDEEMLRRAFDEAAKLSPGAVIVERHIEGEDHRMLVVGGKLLMATHRIPGGVIGDGTSSLAQLVEQINADPRRGTGKRSLLIRLTLDEEAQSCLTEQQLTPASIPETGQFVRLRRTANISTGGTASDVTTMVHPDNRIIAERAAQIVGLDIAGVDFLCPDISRSWREVGGAVCEVNAQPGFRPHWLGDPSRDINGEIIDWLFREKSSRIPTAAITGTNGKSTVARMLHHIWMTAGKNTGVCTTSGVWIGHHLISDQNLSGNPGGRMLLNDPVVEAAVIEMPRKGLICFGHPCDCYDVAAFLNVQDDHIGVDGINKLEEMARLKAEVLERAVKAVVVNAEDSLCLAMLEYAGTDRHILVARSSSPVQLQAHIAQGGEAVFIQVHQGTPWIVLVRGAQQEPLMPLAEIPATMNGVLRLNETNALFAVALAWAQAIPSGIIRQALASFTNSPEHNPGRYNFIDGFPFQVLLDFGHNPDGVRELCKVVSKLPVAGKRRLLSLKLGNRHRSHLELIAPVLAHTFDTFILGCASTYVRRCADYVSDDPEATMLAASRDCLIRQGVAAEFITTERDQNLALRFALDSAQPGDLLVLLAEPGLALPILEELRTQGL